jgi:hypothetical protein
MDGKGKTHRGAAAKAWRGGCRVLLTIARGGLCLCAVRGAGRGAGRGVMCWLSVGFLVERGRAAQQATPTTKSARSVEAGLSN